MLRSKGELRFFIGFGGAMLSFQHMLASKKVNECGGILGFVTTDKKQDARLFCVKNKSYLQRMPYQQCGIAYQLDQGSVLSHRFTTLGEDKLSEQLQSMSVDEYLLNPRMEVSKPEQDCFHKLDLFLKENQNQRSNFCILSTRYASTHGDILDGQAHPCVYGDVGVFHNGFISNYKQLQQEAFGNTTEDLTDTQMIARLISLNIEKGATLKQAIQSVVEESLFGTWRLAIYTASQLFIATNSGDMFLGHDNKNTSVVFATDDLLANDLKQDYSFSKIKKNQLVEINRQTFELSYEQLQKKMKISRKPTLQKHIYLQEIIQAVDTVNFATDNNAKFINSHQVLLGGFDKSMEELVLVQNLMMAANGTSKIAAEYGAWMMKRLRCFNTIKVSEGSEILTQNLEKIKFCGYLTLSQSGGSENLVSGVKQAASLGITCINVVNVEDSAVTRVINELQEAGESWYDSENIGMYMKSGFCYSDVKSFIPEVISLALVSLWFSYHKTNTADKAKRLEREMLIQEIQSLPQKLWRMLAPDYGDLYVLIAECLKDQHNLFLLAKGSGFFVANLMAQKFMQVCCLNAEAYPCAEFRHGPLSMIDDEEKTPVIFFVLNDEHLQQVLSNILQVKERGATTIVITNLPDIRTKIESKKLDFVIEMPPGQNEYLASLQCVIPLQMICYHTSLKRGLDPDKQLFDAIDFMHEFD